ncbi:MAG: 30S ribosomal protein S8 [Anaerolineaceae bacterium 4572_78]|nr:MAG: 30S ribosomal protein S8 [Anaerolineaceae bacterium 4572_78]
MVTDTIADMLTRIRNAMMVRRGHVTMPNTKILASIARILQEEGYISRFKVIPDSPQAVLQIKLKYTNERHPKSVITGLKRISKPGCRVYTQRKKIPWVRSGLGITILSTPEGVMTGRSARKSNVGGEILCYVW